MAELCKDRILDSVQSHACKVANRRNCRMAAHWGKKADDVGFPSFVTPRFAGMPTDYLKKLSREKVGNVFTGDGPDGFVCRKRGFFYPD